MNPDLIRLAPGIAAIFDDAGYITNVTEINDQLAVTVSKAGVTETRMFPYPSVNKDLSVPLLAWKIALISGEQL